MKLKVVPPFDFSSRMKVGQVVEVDKIKRYKDCGSGFMVRVVGIWKTPKWFDLYWFIKKPAQPPAEKGDE